MVMQGLGSWRAKQSHAASGAWWQSHAEERVLQGGRALEAVFNSRQLVTWRLGPSQAGQRVGQKGQGLVQPWR